METKFQDFLFKTLIVSWLFFLPMNLVYAQTLSTKKSLRIPPAQAPTISNDPVVQSSPPSAEIVPFAEGTVKNAKGRIVNVYGNMITLNREDLGLENNKKEVFGINGQDRDFSAQFQGSEQGLAQSNVFSRPNTSNRRNFNSRGDQMTLNPGTGRGSQLGLNPAGDQMALDVSDNGAADQMALNGAATVLPQAFVFDEEKGLEPIRTRGTNQIPASENSLGKKDLTVREDSNSGSLENSRDGRGINLARASRGFDDNQFILTDQTRLFNIDSIRDLSKNDRVFLTYRPEDGRNIVTFMVRRATLAHQYEEEANHP